MSKVLWIAVREFVETVKTRTFIITTVFMPMLIVGIMLATERIADLTGQEERPTRTIALAGAPPGVLEALLAQVEAHNAEFPRRRFELSDARDQTPDALREQIAAGRLYAYVLVPLEVLSGAGPAEIATQDGQLETQKRIERMVEKAVVAVRFRSAEPPIDPALVERLQTPLAFRSVDVRSGAEMTGSEMVRLMTPFAFMFFLFMGTMNISQGLLTSLIEEKSSRVIEVLLSAVSPTQLMAGKILGMVAVGTLLMSIWAAVGWYGAQSRGMSYLVQPHQVTYLALYFVPGFLLTAALLAAIGSACNTLKDAQSLAFPITIIIIVPMMLWWHITMNPGSLFSVVLSYIPPITPFVMVLRICADPRTPLVQIVTTLALLWASVLAAIWAAGRVFRIGVLMYGKPPTPAELLRWIVRA